MDGPYRYFGCTRVPITGGLTPSCVVTSAPPSTTRATGWALVGLLVVAAAWGSSFPLTKVLLGSMSALNFLAVRFALAAIVMAAIVMAAVFLPALRRLSRRAVVRGLWLG